MVTDEETICPKCGGELHHYDTVKRIVRTKYGEQYWLELERMICVNCNSTHRVVPDILIPYRHYEKEIIQGFIQGSISSFDLEYEDYPSESTINEWHRSYNLHFLRKR